MWVYEKTKKIKQHFTDIFKCQIFVFLHIWLGLKKKSHENVFFVFSSWLCLYSYEIKNDHFRIT